MLTSAHGQANPETTARDPGEKSGAEPRRSGRDSRAMNSQKKIEWITAVSLAVLALSVTGLAILQHYRGPLIDVGAPVTKGDLIVLWFFIIAFRIK